MTENEKLSQRRLVSWKKSDMKAIKEAADRKGMRVTTFIRMVVLDCLGRNNKPM